MLGTILVAATIKDGKLVECRCPSLVWQNSAVLFMLPASAHGAKSGAWFSVGM